MFCYKYSNLSIQIVTLYFLTYSVIEIFLFLRKNSKKILN